MKSSARAALQVGTGGRFSALSPSLSAHLSLGSSILIARCREIQIEIQNQDNTAGVVAVAMLLRDWSSPGQPTVYLGQQSLVSSEPEHFAVKSSPVFETLRFAIPAHTKIRKFDKITVMLLPDVEHAIVTPKIAVEQFQLFPR